MGIAAALPSGVLQYPWPVEADLGPFLPVVGLVNVVKSAYGFGEILVGWVRTDPGSPREADSITIRLRTGSTNPPAIFGHEVNIRPGVPRRFRVDGSDNVQIEITAVNTDPTKHVAFSMWGADPVRFQKL